MGFFTPKGPVAMHATPVDADMPSNSGDEETHVVMDDNGARATFDNSGAARAEAMQKVWGKHGKKFIIAGMAMMTIIFELDNSTVYNYQNYATSSFDKLSFISTLSTAGTIIFAVIKPVIAKVSDVIGRGETYIFTISCYLLSYFLCASAKSINAYAAGYIFYCIGQSGTNLMNDIITSDLTTAKWRALLVACLFFPFLITPWVSAFIVESVVNGIGWRWGIGMFAILMPFCASFIIVTLLYYQRKAKKAGMVVRKKISVYDFFSLIDLGGSILLCGGFAMLLLPLSLASSSAHGWRTPWLDAMIALGAVFLIALPFYEKYMAKHPIVPFYYLKEPTIILCILLVASDEIGFSCTHTYLYAWSTIAHNFDARNATFLAYTNGVTQCLSGIVAGWIMLKTRKYKWLTMVGVIIRLIGYGVMVRLRGANNSVAELFIVQLIQGIGSGIIQTIVVVVPQVVVPHSEMAQVIALVLCANYLGSSVGSAIAGGIYTGTFKEELAKQLGSSANSTLIDTLYNSITGAIPAWGTPQRTMINIAYSNVLRYMTWTAFATGAPSFVFTYFLPNLTLPDDINLVSNKAEAEAEADDAVQEEVAMKEIPISVSETPVTPTKELQ